MSQAHSGRTTVSILPLSDLAPYAEFALMAVHAPAQHPLWVEEWIANVSPKGLIAVIEQDGKPACALALEIVKSGPFHLARFLGGSHANGNFPASTRAFLGSQTFDMAALLSGIRARNPKVDALVLERQLPELDGFANPLLGQPHSTSPNVALAVSLEGGFEALLDRSSGKRKRKKNRAQLRKYEAAGGFRYFDARSPEDVDRMLEAFFEMKAERFRKMGIANVFGEIEIQNFFRSLFRDALLEARPPFVLQALEVGGKLRAVTGSSLSGNRITCDFAAIAEDDLLNTSPGEFLFFENLRTACAAGFEIYDFGVGDEPYKRQWCDIETNHFDIVLPLSFKGRLLVTTLGLKTGVKTYVKNSPTLWNLVKRLRRSTSGKQSSEPQEE
ncbi:GNAT family N-acetyltransferase [Mesorhizobium sp. VNQ89]|uniref:GNAT family N-acetyltransferase n=1 Tax=Mesorhizobium quangtriensis TaxID=3157709 RepID=UPI0032B71764